MVEHVPGVVHERRHARALAPDELEGRAGAKLAVADIVGRLELAGAPGAALAVGIDRSVADVRAQLVDRVHSHDGRLGVGVECVRRNHRAAVHVVEVVEAVGGAAGDLEAARADDILAHLGPRLVQVNALRLVHGSLAADLRCANATGAGAVGEGTARVGALGRVGGAHGFRHRRLGLNHAHGEHEEGRCDRTPRAEDSHHQFTPRCGRPEVPPALFSTNSLPPHHSKKNSSRGGRGLPIRGGRVICLERFTQKATSDFASHSNGLPRAAARQDRCGAQRAQG